MVRAMRSRAGPGGRPRAPGAPVRLAIVVATAGVLACLSPPLANGANNAAITITVRVVGPPHIDSLSASSGPGGSQIWLSGVFFGDTRGSTTVVFGPGQAESPEYLSWSDTAINCRVPAGLNLGANDVRVLKDGVPSNALDFTVTAPSELCVDDSNTTGTETGSARWPFNTIGEAVGASTSGDTVKVAAGAYRETVLLDSTTLYLRGGYVGGADYAADGGDFADAARSLDRVMNPTAIEGQGARRCVVFAQCPGGELSGFILRNGSTAGNGGGILCDGSSPVIQACTLSGNAAAGDGGGLYGLDCALSLAHSVLRGNTAGGGGGGVALEGGAGEIAHNEVYGNAALEGGGITCSDSAASVHHNVVTGNQASGAGGGAALRSSDALAFVSNTVAHNRGGGVLCQGPASPVLKHGILWGNEGGSGGQLQCAAGAAPLVSYCNIQGGLPEAALDGGENRGEEPRFVAPGGWIGSAWTQGDYHLMSEAGHWTPGGWVADATTSPCIDVGDLADGVGLEPAPNGGCMNLGAYGGTVQASKSPAVAVRVLTPDPSGAETLTGDPPDTGLFRIRRIGRTGALTVHFLLAGTATRGGEGDYTVSVGGAPLAGSSVVIPDGQDDVDVLVEPRDDATPEGTETVALVLLAGAGYRPDADPARTMAWVAILDNDAAVGIVATDPDAAEPGSSGMFRISRSDAGTGDLTVTFARQGSATPGKDYLLQANGLALPSNSVVVPGTPGYVDIEVAVLDDTAAEGTETVVLSLLGTAAYGLDLDPAKHTATVAIADDEPVVSVEALDPSAGEPNDHGRFRIHRTPGGLPLLPVKFKLGGTARLGSDYVLRVNGVDNKGSVEVPAVPGYVDIQVVVLDDALPEPTETVILPLARSKSYVLDPDPARQAATVTIADDEAVVSIAATDPAAAEPADNGSFRISRTGGPAGDLLVSFSRLGTAASGVDYTLRVGGIALPGNSVAVPAAPGFVDVELAVNDDALAEGTELATLALVAGPGYAADPAQNNASVTIQDDEPLVRIEATDPVAAEPADHGAFRISRSNGGPPSLTVAFTLSGTASAGKDYVLRAGGVDVGGSIAVPSAPGYVDLQVVVLDDAVVENDETVTARLLNGPGYGAATPGNTATVAIADDEPIVSVQALNPVASEPNTNGVFRISRSPGGAPLLPVSFKVTGTAKAGSDYLLRSGGLDVKSSVNVPAVPGYADIEVVVIDDVLGDPDETVVLTLSKPKGFHLDPDPARQSATVTIADDEPTLSIEALDPAASEPAAPGVFRISRTPVGPTNVTVNLARSGTATFGAPGTTGADYMLLVNGASLTATSVAVPAAPGYLDIVLVPLDDAVREATETATLTLVAAAGYGLDVNPARRSAAISIADDEGALGLGNGTGESKGEPEEGGIAILLVPNRGPAPLEVAAIALGVPLEAVCEWDFGDGATAEGPLVTHTYSSPGTYVVTLDVLGQRLEAEVEVTATAPTGKK